jgi:hypothetical protein
MLKSMSVKLALLVSLATFAAAGSAVAVNVPIPAGDAEVGGAMATVLQDSAVKGVMNAKKQEVMAEKAASKPLMNKLMPQMEGVMMPVIKEMILPEQMKGLQTVLPTRIAPQF